VLERPPKAPDTFFTQCGVVQPFPFPPITNAISTVFSATSGTDYGPTTIRPIRMQYLLFIAALEQLAADPTFIPFGMVVHTGTLDVTPPCTLTGEVTGTSGEAQTMRAGCFIAESITTASGGDSGQFTSEGCPGDDDTCDPACNSVNASWGASGSIVETINFGDVAITEASWADIDPATGYVYVAYSFSAGATWQCTQSGCVDPSDQENQCLNSDGNPCGPAGSDTSGIVCTNVIGVGDPDSPPPGTISSMLLSFSGDGWSTDAISSLFFQDVTLAPSCEQSFVIAY
jgi:hypothetical protein